MNEILIVDDERTMRDALKALFVSEGFTVRTALGADDALAKFTARRPDLVLLDVMMPKKNGFLACEDFRRIDPTVPIVFFTAKDSDSDQIRGISLGADDFIPKSASEGVLVARIRRALDRTQSCASQPARPPQSQQSSTIKISRFTLDLRRRVLLDGRRALDLTKTEFDILACLAVHRGKVVSDSELFEALRGNGYIGEKGTIRTHIKNLRRKLGPAGELITNVYNAGYYLVV